MIKAIIHISLKEGLLDPQGEALSRALKSMGYSEVGNVRIGKRVEVTLDEEDLGKARIRVEGMCQSLIANSVIEDYDINNIS